MEGAAAVVGAVLLLPRQPGRGRHQLGEDQGGVGAAQQGGVQAAEGVGQGAEAFQRLRSPDEIHSEGSERGYLSDWISDLLNRIKEKGAGKQ